MSYSKDNYIKVRSAFEEKRRRATDGAIERREELHAKFPEIKALDDELALTSMDIFTATMSGGENAQKRIEEIRANNLALQKNRAELLAAHGYPADYTKVKYECPICEDTGNDNGNMCSCFRRALCLENYKSSGLGNLIKKQSFENFSVDFYTGAEKEKITKIYNFCKSYAQSFTPGESESILLRGATGLGKTHLSTSIAKVILDGGYNVIYDSAQNIFTEFEERQFRGNPDADTKKYLECDLLIIDDLGTEMINNFTVSCFYNIINTRLNRSGAMIINTNLKPEEIRAKYSDRIFSRIFGEFTMKEFVGEDIRFKTKLS